LRPPLKIACLLGVAVVLIVAVVWWEMRREKLEKFPRNVRAPTSSSGRQTVRGAPGATSYGRSTVSGFGSARAQRPSRVLPTGATTPKKGVSSSGLERVALIVNSASDDAGADGRASFAERVKAVRAITTELTDQEVEAFYRYLLAPTSKSGQDRVGENWLRNEIMDKLVQQTAAPDGLSDMLVAVYQDPAQDVVMRDYSVQHMVPAYEQVSAPEQANIQKAVWKAVGETDSSIAGTALLSLMEISGESSNSVTAGETSMPTTDTNRAQLARAAMQLAANDRCGELARITAVQVCGRLRVTEAFPIVQQLAQEAESMPLRIAATAALGEYGTPEASNLLVRIAASSDPRQVLAAQSALNRLTQSSSGLPKGAQD
jgi:hypothetical protein